MKHYCIIKLTKDKLSQVHDMAEIAFRNTYKDILSQEQIEYMMEWMYALPNLQRQFDEGHIYHILLDGLCNCGYVSFQPTGYDADKILVYHLHKLYLLPSYQGKGLGKLLFREAIDLIRAHAPQLPVRVELNVNRNNPAVNFYKSMGMTILSQGDFNIGNGFYMNDYIMELTLTL